MKIGGVVLIVLGLLCLPQGLIFIIPGGLLIWWSGKRVKSPPKSKDIPSITSTRYTGGSTFGEWHPKAHRGAAQTDRFERASHEYMELRKYNDETGFAEIYSSSGNTYITSLDSCSCPDFDKRCRPCKHIYFLAMKMGYTSNDFYSN